MPVDQPFNNQFRDSRNAGNANRPGPVKFVFRDLYINHQPIREEKSNGLHDGSRLLLGENLELLDRDIRYLKIENDQVHVGWQDEQQAHVVASMIVDADSFAIASAINYGLSRRSFDFQLEQAALDGQGHRCRDRECQFCRAKILSMEDYPWTPQIYCPYCDSLNTTISVEQLHEHEKDYRVCHSCEMYSRPRQFTIAYFYFVIVHAGVHHRVTRCCPGCMRPHAWKMIFGNLFGVLGMPLAITQLIRVYRDSIKKGPFQGLDEANRLLRRGRVEKALDRYWKVIDRHPVSAGVLYNVAKGLIARGDLPHARQTLQMALENCANYPPAQRLLDALGPEEADPAR